MTSRDWMHDDAELSAQLTDALAADDVVIQDELADRMRQTARLAFSWLAAGEELERLTLCVSSLAEVDAGVRSSSDATATMMEFQGENLGLELDIQQTAILGQVYPAHVGVVTLLTPTGPVSTTVTNQVGGFVVDRPRSGPCRFRFESPTADGITDWILLDR